MVNAHGGTEPGVTARFAPHPVAAQLRARFEARTGRIAILGLGFAGLPMAIELAQSGFSVVGLDIDANRVQRVNAGISPVTDVPDDVVNALVTADRLSASTSFGVLADVDAVIICVPTPLTIDRRPDMQFVVSAGRSIADHLHPGMLVIMQSTCPPGATRSTLLPLLQTAGDLRLGEDYFVACAPERIDPGNKKFTAHNTPKVVGGMTDECGTLCATLFESFIDRVVKVSSPEVAELSKLTENTFRFVNISFVNEIAQLCDRMGVSAWEVIDAAATKPFAFLPHYPGPGVGGHCIPVSPFLLNAAVKEHGLTADMIEAAGRVNEEMPRFLVAKLQRLLAERGKQISGARVLLLGVTYKPDLSDVRESPALALITLFQQQGVTVEYHDPYIPSLDFPEARLSRVNLDRELLQSVDCVIIITAHTWYDWNWVMENSVLILDTRNVFRFPTSRGNVVLL